MSYYTCMYSYYRVPYAAMPLHMCTAANTAQAHVTTLWSIWGPPSQQYPAYTKKLHVSSFWLTSLVHSSILTIFRLLFNAFDHEVLSQLTHQNSQVLIK